MSFRATIRRWPLWVGFVGLLLLADAGVRPARASGCHVPDRPTLGLQQVEFAAGRGPKLTRLERTSEPGCRSIPCPDDPAARPDHSSHLVAWSAAPAPGRAERPAVRLPLLPADLLAPLARGSRLDRPPRPA